MFYSLMRWMTQPSSRPGIGSVLRAVAGASSQPKRGVTGLGSPKPRATLFCLPLTLTPLGGWQSLRAADHLARRVADVASGFPKLAVRLAEELARSARPRSSTPRSPPDVEEILLRALPDERLLRNLKPIALFSAVGFDDELGYELEAVAEVFGLVAAELRVVCETELTRGFVSRAGRYRMVSPRLVAIWLASDLIGETPDFDERIMSLPESLREAFIRQLEYFGPDSRQLPAALERVPSRTGGFDDARLLLRPPHASCGRRRQSSRTGERQSRNSFQTPRTKSYGFPAPPRPGVGSRGASVVPGDVGFGDPQPPCSCEPRNGELGEQRHRSLCQRFLGLSSGDLASVRRPCEGWLDTQISTVGAADLELLSRAAAARFKVHHVRTVVGFHGGGAD